MYLKKRQMEPGSTAFPWAGARGGKRERFAAAFLGITWTLIVICAAIAATYLATWLVSIVLT